jgi:hypothetical protein
LDDLDEIPLNNHYIVIGLMSNFIDIQRRSFLKFMSASPNSRAFEFTYNIICAIGLYSKLTKEHKVDCLEAVLSDTNIRKGQLVANILMYTNEKSDILSKYYAFDPQYEFTFRSLCQIEYGLMVDSQMNFAKPPWLSDKFHFLKPMLLEGVKHKLYDACVVQALLKSNFDEKIDDYVCELKDTIQ